MWYSEAKAAEKFYHESTYLGECQGYSGANPAPAYHLMTGVLGSAKGYLYAADESYCCESTGKQEDLTPPQSDFMDLMTKTCDQGATAKAAAACSCDDAKAPLCNDSGGCYEVAGGADCNDGGGPTAGLCPDTCEPCGGTDDGDDGDDAAPAGDDEGSCTIETAYYSGDAVWYTETLAAGEAVSAFWCVLFSPSCSLSLSFFFTPVQ